MLSFGKDMLLIFVLFEFSAAFLGLIFLTIGFKRDSVNTIGKAIFHSKGSVIVLISSALFGWFILNNFLITPITMIIYLVGIIFRTKEKKSSVTMSTIIGLGLLISAAMNFINLQYTMAVVCPINPAGCG